MHFLSGWLQLKLVEKANEQRALVASEVRDSTE